MRKEQIAKLNTFVAENAKMQKTAMRGEKIFYTEKRRRHRHAREIFFHREAVKISSRGKNPWFQTQKQQ